MGDMIVIFSFHAFQPMKPSTPVFHVSVLPEWKMRRRAWKHYPGLHPEYTHVRASGQRLQHCLPESALLLSIQRYGFEVSTIGTLCLQFRKWYSEASENWFFVAHVERESFFIWKQWGKIERRKWILLALWWIYLFCHDVMFDLCFVCYRTKK